MTRRSLDNFKKAQEKFDKAMFSSCILKSSDDACLLVLKILNGLRKNLRCNLKHA